MVTTVAVVAGLATWTGPLCRSITLICNKVVVLVADAYYASGKVTSIL